MKVILQGSAPQSNTDFTSELKILIFVFCQTILKFQVRLPANFQ